MKLSLIRTAAVILFLNSSLAPVVSFAAFAKLTDWIGHLNTEGNNNYTVISTSAVGGTFQSRMSPPPPAGTFPENWYLRDQSLAGGLLGFDDALTMSGRITLDNPNDADPSWFFGWYSSTDYRSRLGISAAKAVVYPFPSTPPNAIRMQLAYGNAGPLATTPITDNGGASATNRAVTPAGTYDFSFSYTPGPSNTLTVHIQSESVDWRRENLTVSHSAGDVFDRFGFLQVGASLTAVPATSTATFGVVISDLNYTGQSPVPEPSTLMLVAAGMAAVAVRSFSNRRRRTGFSLAG